MGQRIVEKDQQDIDTLICLAANTINQIRLLLHAKKMPQAQEWHDKFPQQLEDLEKQRLLFVEELESRFKGK